MKIKFIYKILLVIFIIIFSNSAFAGQREFCDGFEEGYKTIKGDMVLVPLCPLAPITPLNSTDFREGLKAGMRAANRS